MGRVKLFPSQTYDVKQPRDQVVCRTPSNGILCAPSASGKTVLLVSMILEQYRGCFERVYIMSPSIDMDPQWEPVKKYIREDLGVNTDREQSWWDEWDEGALRNILAQQKKITQQSKQLGMKKLYQVLIVLDDMADSPQVHKKTGDGILDTLFIRGRHYCCNTWVSTQKLRLMSSLGARIAIYLVLPFVSVWHNSLLLKHDSMRVRGGLWVYRRRAGSQKKAGRTPLQTS